MAVKVSRLFKDIRFQKLPEITKLFYIYLVTNPNLNVVGVLSPNLEVACLELSCSMEDIRVSSRELIALKYIYIKDYEGTIYFIIPEHFNTIPKSESTISKVSKVISSLPRGLSQFLDEIGINVKAKVKEFIKPTAEEVTEYSLSLGYLIDGNAFISYYEEQAERYGKKGVWVDTRGTQVRDWKAKLRKIWCKDFETFHILRDGKVITPDGWKRGKPFSKSLAIDIELKKEYDKRKGSST